MAKDTAHKAKKNVPPFDLAEFWICCRSQVALVEWEGVKHLSHFMTCRLIESWGRLRSRRFGNGPQIRFPMHFSDSFSFSTATPTYDLRVTCKVGLQVMTYNISKFQPRDI